MNSHTETCITMPIYDLLEVKEECRFSYLNQIGFVRAYSGPAQFILLVNDAWRKTGLPMDETVRDYLAMVLYEHVAKPDLFQKLADFHYVWGVLEGSFLDPAVMPELADASLMYLSFVPGRSQSRREPRSLTYSARLGESLYRQLATKAGDKDDFRSKAYRVMKERFGMAIMVMQSLKFARRDEVTLPPGALEIPPDSRATNIKQLYQMYTQPSVGTA